MFGSAPGGLLHTGFLFDGSRVREVTRIHFTSEVCQRADDGDLLIASRADHAQ